MHGVTDGERDRGWPAPQAESAGVKLDVREKVRFANDDRFHEQKGSSVCVYVCVHMCVGRESRQQKLLCLGNPD